MTRETNPEVLQILYDNCSGKMSSSDYLLKTEAGQFTNEDFWINNITSIFTGKDITHFEEFEYFTGITTIQRYCFSSCKYLKDIVIPKSVTNIEMGAFQYAIFTKINIPQNVKSINQDAFIYCKQLTEITVDSYNVTYCAYEGHLYKGINPTALYMIAPGAESYKMPDETTSVYNNEAA